MTIAIMSAMHEENALLIAEMKITREEQFGSRTYYTGELFGTEVIVVFSHWGKVAAAITATSLISRYHVSEILFTGVAGAVDRRLSVGDIVVADTLFQHDMDASPIIERHEIPLLGRSGITTDTARRGNLMAAAEAFINKGFLSTFEEATIEQFKLVQPTVCYGDIASGDQFVSQAATGRDIVNRLPTVTCVEMEGASVAQVCQAFDVPFTVVRTISDAADEQADIDFQAFISEVASTYSLEIVRRYLAGQLHG